MLRPNAMRVKSRWFRGEKPKSPVQVAGAVAFIVWRVAHNALQRMRAARFEIDAGAQYFAFLAEFLVFLIAIADRIAYARFTPEARIEFTTALAHRVGDILEDNESELLGSEAGSSKRRFIVLANERSADYAAFGYGEDGPDFGFLRYLGSRVNEIMPPKDQAWTVAQVMESEAPDAAVTLQRAMRDLLTVGPRPATGARVQLAGE